MNGDLEPRRVDQVPDGCWTACIAGLTGIPYETFIPLVEQFSPFETGEQRNGYRMAVHDILTRHGWALAILWKQCPRGYAIAGGPTIRDTGHCVIVRDGQLWHDPHESRAGLLRVDEYELPIRIIS